MQKYPVHLPWLLLLLRLSLAMSSKINTFNLPSLRRPPSFPTSVKSFRLLLRNSSSSSSSSDRGQTLASSSPSGDPSRQLAIKDGREPGRSYNINFQTLEGCKLGISRYPDFEYNAGGGAGTGTGREEGGDGNVSVSFDIGTLYIPPLTSTTTKFLGLPLPPFLKIDIVPELFQGTVGKDSGKIDLRFRAKFWFSVGSIYKAPPLMVETTLTSEESQGAMRRGKGERMSGEKCTLVGVAVVEPIDDVLMNSFLGLPTECIAVMKAKISLD